MDFISIVISSIIGAVGGFFLSYLSETGKNFATKKDIAQITDSQDKVHAQYNERLETLRSKLEEQLHTHKLTFEKEFEIYSHVWSTLDDLSEATYRLRPAIELVDPNESEKERKEQRLKEFSECYNKFLAEVRKNRPFYPSEIYQVLSEIIKKATQEFVQYRSGQPSSSYWENAEGNIKDLSVLIDNACDAIRKRISPN